jgi:hypothetical protein
MGRVSLVFISFGARGGELLVGSWGSCWFGWSEKLDGKVSSLVTVRVRDLLVGQRIGWQGFIWSVSSCGGWSCWFGGQLNVARSNGRAP